MSDLKRSCPACDSWTSSVGIAFRDGKPCPVCGLPAEAAAAFDAAEARGADAKLLERYAEAERSAAEARAEAARLRRALDAVREAIMTAVFYDEGRRVTARVVEVRKDESGVATFTTEDAEGVRRDVPARLASVDRRAW